ncbi:hypothetical protein Tco_0570896 [Tanacetum coccineum]
MGGRPIEDEKRDKIKFLCYIRGVKAEILGEGEKLMGLQFIQLDLRLRKIPSRSFRPVKSAEILWQFWASIHFGFHLLMVILGASGSTPCGCVVNP